MGIAQKIMEIFYFKYFFKFRVITIYTFIFLALYILADSFGFGILILSNNVLLFIFNLSDF